MEHLPIFHPKRFFLIVAASAVLFVFSGSSIAEKSPIRGPGAKTCGAWTQERKNDRFPAELAWVMGFISSYNHYMEAEIFGDSDFNAIAGWIDNYCASNPLDTVYIGAVRLVEALKKRSLKK
jgi:hypothetical protein